MPGTGEYTLRVRIEPPAFPRHDKINGCRFVEPVDGDKIHIPLPEDEALRGLFKVKPTKDMPRPGADPTGKKKAGKKSAKKTSLGD